MSNFGNIKNVAVPKEWVHIMQEKYFRDVTGAVERKFVETFGVGHDTYKARYNGKWPEHFRNLMQEWFDLPDREALERLRGGSGYDKVLIETSAKYIKRLQAVANARKISVPRLVASLLESTMDSAPFQELEYMVAEQRHNQSG